MAARLGSLVTPAAFSVFTAASWLSLIHIYELELPEEAKKYFMYEEYGRDAAINEGGSFTEQGYIYNNRNTFTKWYDCLLYTSNPDELSLPQEKNPIPDFLR